MCIRVSSKGKFIFQYPGAWSQIEMMMQKRLSDTFSIFVNKVTNSCCSMVYSRTICTEDFTFLNINMQYTFITCMPFIFQHYHFKLKLSILKNIERVCFSCCSSIFTLLNVISFSILFCPFSTRLLHKHQTIWSCLISLGSLISRGKYYSNITL